MEEMIERTRCKTYVGIPCRYIRNIHVYISVRNRICNIHEERMVFNDVCIGGLARFVYPSTCSSCSSCNRGSLWIKGCLHVCEWITWMYKVFKRPRALA